MNIMSLFFFQLTYFEIEYTLYYIILLLYILIIVCVTVLPELFEDATKRFSAQFVHRIEHCINDTVSSLTLAPGNNAFSTLDSNFKLAKLELTSSSDQVSKL